MKVLEERVKQLERKVEKLENYRDSDFKIINTHNENLATIILKLENITKSLETVTSNFKEAINRSNARNEEERVNVNKRINTLEQKVNNLNIKFENDKENIENKLDERTIVKDSKSLQDINSKIIWLIISAILGYIIGKVLI